MARKSRTVGAEGDAAETLEPAAEAVLAEPVEPPTEPEPESIVEPESIIEPDSIVEPEPELVREPVPDPSRQTARRGGGWIGPVLGGVIAAGLGYGVATYLAAPPSGAAVSSEDLAALKAALKTQDADLSALEARVGAIPPTAAPEEVQALDTRLARLETAAADAHDAADASLAAMAARLTKLEERLQTLERRPTASGGVSAGAIQSFEDELNALRAELESQRAEGQRVQAEVASVADAAEVRLKAAEDEAARIRAQAEADARHALSRAAVTHLRAALESGAALDGALADIAAAGLTVPAELAEQAQGVPTLQMLQARFDPAAREALAASLRETAGEGWLDKSMAFLRSQSGARSLTPRAGDDPDAALSRAAAALGAGDVGGAVTELDGLPQAGKDVMAEWIALAGRRMAAAAAVQALSQAVD